MHEHTTTLDKHFTNKLVAIKSCLLGRFGLQSIKTDDWRFTIGKWTEFSEVLLQYKTNILPFA